LKNAGFSEEARRVFALAEPLDLLAAHSPMAYDPQDEKGELLENWAEAAIHFRSVDSIIDTIRKIRREADRFARGDDEAATRSFQNRLLYKVGLALLTEQRWEELSKIAKLFNINHMEDLQWWFWCQVHAWKDCASVGDTIQAVHFLEQALEASVSGLTHDALLASAEGVYWLLEDKEGAQELLQYVPQPNLRTELLSSESGLHPFLQRFRLNRLLYALGDQRLPAEIIPDPSQLREQGIVYFERALCVIARIWAEAWCGRKLDGATIKLEVAPLLRLFNKSWQETRDWTNWYTAQNARSEFYELLIDAVAQHGSQAIEALRTAFEREWDNVATSVHWSADIRRKIILALRYGGIHRNWVIEQLRILEEGMLEGCDVSGRIDACHKQAEAWLTLGDQASARRLLGQMLQMSFGVDYRKDYRNRSGCQNITLVITSSDGVPCAHGYASLIATGTLGTDSA
jgi:hypothetical protein